MAFESLSEKLQNVFKNLKGKGKLSEADVKAAMKEVKIALLEADVNFKVVKEFIKTVTEKSVGEEVLSGLNPAQMVIKIVREEMTALMGGKVTELVIKPEFHIIMMAGLQGAGKTTMTAKLAVKYTKKGKRCLLIACDVYRPAAIKQLQVLGEANNIEVFSMGDQKNPVDIAKAGIEYAKKNAYNLVFIDTAGRLQIDDTLMDELTNIKSAVAVDDTILVIDSMIGQDSVNVAQTFGERVGITGVILTKMDGDARGGAALSIRKVTDKPILFAGMGEKVSDLEPFYPDRIASRILGMGDVLTLIDKVSDQYDAQKAKELSQKIKKASFGFDDFLEQMNQMKKMGGIGSLLSMLPGAGLNMGDIESKIDDKQMGRIEAIILSMTPEERSNPDLINPSRKRRIAKGAGVDIADVNRLVKQFEQVRKMMKQLPGMMNAKGKRGLFGKNKFPFSF